MSSGHEHFSPPPERDVSTYHRGIATHYETLGVRPDATAEQIRAAYVAHARRRHPDAARSTVVPAADFAPGEPTMSELNEAYQVLRRPDSRVQYDRSLRAAAVSTGLGHTTDGVAGATADDVDLHDVDDATGHGHGRRSPGARLAGRVLAPAGPARMPWKLMAVAAVIGSTGVLVTAALADAPGVEPPDGIVRVGSCVTIESNGDAREVACAESPHLVVALVLPTGSQCPPAYATHRDRLGLGTLCVETIDDQTPG